MSTWILHSTNFRLCLRDYHLKLHLSLGSTDRVRLRAWEWRYHGRVRFLRARGWRYHDQVRLCVWGWRYDGQAHLRTWEWRYHGQVAFVRERGDITARTRRRGRCRGRVDRRCNMKPVQKGLCTGLDQEDGGKRFETSGTKLLKLCRNPVYSGSILRSRERDS